MVINKEPSVLHISNMKKFPGYIIAFSLKLLEERVICLQSPYFFSPLEYSLIKFTLGKKKSNEH